MKEHNMKRIVVLLATLLLSFGLVNAGQVDAVFNSLTPDTIRTQGAATTIDVSWTRDFDVFGASIGIEMYSPDDATWTWTNVGALNMVNLVTTTVDLNAAFDMTKFLVTEQNVDEADADTIMCGGVAMMVGVPTGGPDLVYQYNFVADGDGGDPNWVGTLCLDSCFVPPSGAFVFVNAVGQALPQDFSGELCMPVAQPRNFCPEITGTYGPYTVSHCDVLNFTATATDVESDAIMWSATTTGGGAVTMADGAVTYTPVPGDFGSAVQITLNVWDAFHAEGDCDPVVVDVTVTNNAPTVDCGGGGEIGMGNTFTYDEVMGADADPCDVLTYMIVNVTPAPAGTYSMDMGNGDFEFNTLIADGGNTYTFDVEVSDGLETVACSFDVTVLVTDPFLLKIEKTHQTLQGHFVDVAITLEKGSENFGGFDFLIGYDASALAFTEAALGADLVDCGWEYFTYRYNWNGNCGNACPSGLVRVVGLAETNNGPNHPMCFNPALETEPADYPVEMVTLTFFVSNDRTFECMYAPIRFYWMDCGDNTLSSIGGDTLFVSRYVYEYEGIEITDNQWGFPGWMGAPDICLVGDKEVPVRFIDMLNGGIDIVCADSIDARGDINVNGVMNEIADAVMFTNYFINGLSAFGTHVEASIAASDVNADGIALSVADLVYQVRVIVGDANPYPKPMPDALAEVDFQHNAISMNAPVNVGAALFTFQVNGEIGTPTLADGISMDMKYAVNGDELRVLVYNIGTNAIPAGDNVIVNVPGNVELMSAEVAAYDGFGIDAMVRNLPASFSVKNYPNPFNPQTTIALDLPVASDWSVKIYNVAGQLVKDSSGHNEAGTHNVVWNGTDNSNTSVASGIYFYKVEASNYSVTKKMMLMK
jgi:hypothetical protein